MNLFAIHKQFFITSLLGCLMISPLLSSCGDSGGDTIAGIGGTGITQGEITAFGSIFVNGIEFDTDNSQFEVDGNTNLGQNDLAIGMVVKIQGKIDNSGITGTATSVKYDDEIQGPIAAIPSLVAGSGDTRKILSIFNKTIIIDETSTRYDGTSFDTISKNDIVEISGFDTSTDINATYVKKTGELALGTSEVELKGTISNLSLTTQSFLLSGVNISYTNLTNIDVTGDILSNGLFVEVEGVLQTATEILANEIEEEDESFEDGDEISLQGIVASFVNLSSDFMVGNQPVNASGATFSPLDAVLENGINIELEGNIVNGVLIADEVELREGSVEIKALVTQVDLDNSRIEFQFLSTTGSIFVTTDLQTLFEDEATGDPDFSLSQLMPAEFVKIEGIENGSDIFASQITRLDATGEDTEIQGSVGGFTENSSITILGLDFAINGSEDYEPPNLPSIIKLGDIVELVDTDPIDGTIDKIKLDI